MSLLFIRFLSFSCGLAPGSMGAMSPPFSIDTTISNPVRQTSIFVAGPMLSHPSTIHCPVAPLGLPMRMMMAVFSLSHYSSTPAVVHVALMMMPPACLSTVGPLALPFFAVAATVVFGVAVMDVVAPILTGVPIIVHLIFCSGSIPISVAVVTTRLMWHGWRMRTVSRSLSFLCHAGFVVMVELLTAQERHNARFNNQWPVEVGFHIRSEV